MLPLKTEEVNDEEECQRKIRSLLEIVTCFGVKPV
jgi:hypothetical protein